MLKIGPDRQRKSKESCKEDGEEHVLGGLTYGLEEHRFDTPAQRALVDRACYKMLPFAYTAVIICLRYCRSVGSNSSRIDLMNEVKS